MLKNDGVKLNVQAIISYVNLAREENTKLVQTKLPFLDGHYPGFYAFCKTKWGCESEPSFFMILAYSLGIMSTTEHSLVFIFICKNGISAPIYGYNFMQQGARD